MIVEYIRYHIPPEQQNAFERAYAEAEVALFASRHCLGFELSHCVEDSQSYILRIEWDSLEGHLQQFRQSQDFRTFFQAVRPCVSNIMEMRHYEPAKVNRSKT